MTPESPSFRDRVRAGVATLLASMAAGANRLETWTSRGTRPLLVGLAVFAVLVVGALAIVGGGREVFGWQGGRDRHEHSEMRAKPDGKPELRHGSQAIGKPSGKPEAKPGGKPEAKPGGKPEAKPGGKPEGRPEAPRPPAPPAPLAPPAP